MVVSMIRLRAFCARACFFGSALESARELESAITAMRTSECSAAHSDGGATQSSWASEANRKKDAAASSGVICTIGRPPARITSS